ncbi:hypothetical protein RQP46_008671 [Phenoliferia psychrophenolica]
MHLNDLSAEIFSRIIELALEAPHAASSTHVLLISRQFYLLSLPILYHSLDTSRITWKNLLQLTSLLDPPFRLRIVEYSAARASADRKGVPRVAIPVLLDVLNRTAPNLRRLELNLAAVGSTQVPEHIIQHDIISRIKFGGLEALTLQAWTLEASIIGTIISQNPSLNSLTLHHAHLSPTSFATSLLHPSYATSLLQITLLHPSLTLESLAFMLKTCLALESVQLLDFEWPASTLATVVRSVDAFSPRRRRSPNARPIAPVRHLVLKAKLASPTIPETELPIFVALLASLSSTLESLHFSHNLGTTPFLSVLLAEEVSGSLERLQIGFGSSTPGVGDEGSSDAQIVEAEGGATERASPSKAPPTSPELITGGLTMSLPASAPLSLESLPTETLIHIVWMVYRQDVAYRARIQRPTQRHQASKNQGGRHIGWGGNSLQSVSLVSRLLRELASKHLFEVFPARKALEIYADSDILPRFGATFSAVYLNGHDMAETRQMVKLLAQNRLPNVRHLHLAGHSARMLHQARAPVDPVAAGPLAVARVPVLFRGIQSLKISSDVLPDHAASFLSYTPDLRTLDLSALTATSDRQLDQSLSCLEHLVDLKVDFHGNKREQALPQTWSSVPWAASLRRLDLSNLLDTLAEFPTLRILETAGHRGLDAEQLDIVASRTIHQFCSARKVFNPKFTALDLESNSCAVLVTFRGKATEDTLARERHIIANRTLRTLVWALGAVRKAEREGDGAAIHRLRAITLALEPDRVAMLE